MARLAVLLIAFCPMAYFFSALYSESLFLALAVGCVWLGRTGRWGWAGVLGGLAAAERATGITLVVPLVSLYLYGPRVDRAPAFPLANRRWLRRVLPRYRPGPKLAWVLLVPAGLGAYSLALALLTGDGLAPFHATGTFWFRHFAGPFGGVWDGAVAAWQVVRVPRTRLGKMWAGAWARARGRRRADSPRVLATARQCHQHDDAALHQRPAA